MFSALDDGFLLDLDPMSSSSAGGAAATSSMTGWGGENLVTAATLFNLSVLAEFIMVTVADLPLEILSTFFKTMCP